MNLLLNLLFVFETCTTKGMTSLWAAEAAKQLVINIRRNAHTDSISPSLAVCSLIGQTLTQEEKVCSNSYHTFVLHTQHWNLMKYNVGVNIIGPCSEKAGLPLICQAPQQNAEKNETMCHDLSLSHLMFQEIFAVLDMNWWWEFDQTLSPCVWPVRLVSLHVDFQKRDSMEPHLNLSKMITLIYCNLTDIIWTWYSFCDKYLNWKWDTNVSLAWKLCFPMDSSTDVAYCASNTTS